MTSEPLLPAVVDPEDFTWPAEQLAQLATLTDKQRRFVQEYLIDFNATAATLRAGYNCKDKSTAAQIGWHLLRHSKVAPVVAQLANLSAEELGVSRAYILARLRDVADMTMEDERWDPRVATKALEVLARLRGDMIERKQVDVRTVNVQINDVNLEDLK